MKFKTNIAMVLLCSLGLVACGGGGGSGGGSANTPINPAPESPKSKYEDKNFIDAQEGKDDEITLTTGNPKTYSGQDGTQISAEYAGSGSAAKFTATLKSDYKKFEVGQKEAVYALDARFSGQMLVAVGQDLNQLKRRDVVFTVKDKHIEGHSIKKNSTDFQAIFDKTKINEQDKPSFSGSLHLLNLNSNTHKTGYYTGDFFGKDNEVKGLVGDIIIDKTSNSATVSGSFYAEKEAK